MTADLVGSSSRSGILESGDKVCTIMHTIRISYSNMWPQTRWVHPQAREFWKLLYYIRLYYQTFILVEVHKFEKTKKDWHETDENDQNSDDDEGINYKKKSLKTYRIVAAAFHAGIYLFIHSVHFNSQCSLKLFNKFLSFQNKLILNIQFGRGQYVSKAQKKMPKIYNENK